MYLESLKKKALLSATWGPVLQRVASSQRAVPEIYYLFAFKPEATQHLERFTEAVMRGPSPLSAGMRELIAAFTSKCNNSPFWVRCHAAAAEALLGDPALVRAVLEDFRTAPISQKEKLLFAFLELVAQNSSHGGDVAVLRRAGWTDEEIHDAILVCALFSFYNRWADAAGVQEMAEEDYPASARRLVERGYRITTGGASMGA